MLWLITLGFGAYILACAAAREAWQRRMREHGGKPAGCGMTGEEVARRLLAAEGLEHVGVTRGRNEETARFSARTGKVVLGRAVHGARTVGAAHLAALAVAEAVTPGEERSARAWRRFVTGFLQPLIGLVLAFGLGALVFRPYLWRALLAFWLLAGVVLLAGHVCTLAWEYRVGARAAAMLRGHGWIDRREEPDYEAMRVGAPLRDVKSVGAVLATILRALLPLRGWR